MACIIKLPDETKGIVTFTSPEDRETGVTTKSGFEQLKDRWVVGCHHNWQTEPHNFAFDFSMGRKGSITPSDAPVIDFDASCFSAKEFYPWQNHTKFWDVFHVARAVSHRSIDNFMHVMRKIFDRGVNMRALLLVAIPDDNGDVSPPDPLKLYDDMFSFEEKRMFNFFPIEYNYPFPFDYETLAFYYNSSKVFLNAQGVGLPCRISTQAVACGLPFITYPWKIPLIPNAMQNPPAHYVGSSLDELADLTIKAVNEYSPNNEAVSKASDHFNYEKCMVKLKGMFREFYESRNLPFTDAGWNLHNLDYRIARHHGISIGSNRIPMNVEKFIEILNSPLDQIPIHSENLEMDLCN